MDFIPPVLRGRDAVAAEEILINVQNDKIIQQSRLILTGKVRWRIFITVFYNIVMNMRFLLAGNYL